MQAAREIRIGCAGWSLSRPVQAALPAAAGSHLERYARVFNAVEINSSFYRPHRQATYRRWSDSVPDGFRFCVKLPKSITHQLRLQDADAELARFFDEVAGLGDKLGCLLVQLPPSLAFDAAAAGGFFAGLRQRTTAAVVCEARHAGWFGEDARRLLAAAAVGRVMADPAVSGAEVTPAFDRIAYYRLHGSPDRYRSSYPAPFLESLHAALADDIAAGRDAWCIFDNTQLDQAVPNARTLQALR